MRYQNQTIRAVDADTFASRECSCGFRTVRATTPEAIEVMSRHLAVSHTPEARPFFDRTSAE